MVKIVDITADRPIEGVVRATIVGKVYNMSLSTDQIYTLLAKGATVQEVLPNGKKITLTNRNYNTDNTVKKTVIDQKKIEEERKAAEAAKAEEEAKARAEAERIAAEKAAAEEAKKAEEAAKKKASEDAKKKSENKNNDSKSSDNGNKNDNLQK